MDFLLGTKPTKDVMNVDDASKAEFESYLNEICPLKWWKENEMRFPTLSKLATKYLGVSATSVPAKGVFSAAGNIVNQKRSCLLPENVNMLVFFKKMK